MKSLVRKQTTRSISIAPIIDSFNTAENDVISYPTLEKRKKSVAANHGFTADGLTPQSSFRLVFSDIFLNYIFNLFKFIIITLIITIIKIIVLMIVILLKKQNLNQLQKLLQ